MPDVHEMQRLARFAAVVGREAVSLAALATIGQENLRQPLPRCAAVVRQPLPRFAAVVSRQKLASVVGREKLAAVVGREFSPVHFGLPPLPLPLPLPLGRLAMGRLPLRRLPMLHLWSLQQVEVGEAVDVRVAACLVEPLPALDSLLPAALQSVSA